MIKYGRTSAGRQRWYCRNCKSSSTVRYRPTRAQLNLFLRWLEGVDTQESLNTGYSARSFRRKTAWCWNHFPVSERIEESYDVVYVDGIHLRHDAVVVIAMTNDRILGWNAGRVECASVWEGLFNRIRAPKMVVCDGGKGIQKALRNSWPNTKVQRCVFHAFLNINKVTTKRPKTLCHQEFRKLGLELLRIKTQEQRLAWEWKVSLWCKKWSNYLAERPDNPASTHKFKHQRTVEARNALVNLIKQGTLFTHLEMKKEEDAKCISMTNVIESLNSRIRAMLRIHRGLKTSKQIKAIGWYCYLRTQSLHDPQLAEPFEELLKKFPTNEQIEEARRIWAELQKDDNPAWGDTVTWEELHNPDKRWDTDYD